MTGTHLMALFFLIFLSLYHLGFMQKEIDGLYRLEGKGRIRINNLEQSVLELKIHKGN